LRGGLGGPPPHTGSDINSMKKLQQVLLCTLLTALTVLAGYTAMLIHAATLAVAAVPEQMTAARTELLQEARATRRDLLVRTERQVAGIRGDAVTQLSQIRETADRRVGDTLARADAALDTVNGLRSDLKPALDHSAAIAAQVDDSLPLFLDCDHNPDCVFNRYVGASKGIEKAAANFGQMSSDFRGALPQAIDSWQGIGDDVHGITGNVKNLTTPKWYDRVLGYGLSFGAAYRDLNPGYNVAAGIRGLFTRHKEQ
jgi:hypothetical protein